MTLAQSWYFTSCFSCVTEGMETCHRSECMHWDEERRAIKAAGLKQWSLWGSTVPAFTTTTWASLWLQYCLQRSRKIERWLGSLLSLCVPAYWWAQHGWHQGLQSTFTTANRKAGVLCGLDGEAVQIFRFLIIPGVLQKTRLSPRLQVTED